MDINTILLILSLLGDIPMQAHAARQPIQPAAYATWTTPKVLTYPCPDPKSDIDPMGTPMIVARTESKCSGATCVSKTAAAAVTVYPDSMTCKADVKEKHHQMFASMVDAGQFRIDCPKDQCQDWQARQATDAETVDYVLEKKFWRIDHIPGGDAYSYPDGIYQVWPTAERQFENPLGTGKSALDAIADALQGEHQ